MYPTAIANSIRIIGPRPLIEIAAAHWVSKFVLDTEKRSKTGAVVYDALGKPERAPTRGFVLAVRYSLRLIEEREKADAELARQALAAKPEDEAPGNDPADEYASFYP